MSFFNTKKPKIETKIILETIKQKEFTFTLINIDPHKLDKDYFIFDDIIHSSIDRFTPIHTIENESTQNQTHRKFIKDNITTIDKIKTNPKANLLQQ